MVTLESGDVDESCLVMLRSHLYSLRCSGSMNNDNNNIHDINILMMIKLKMGKQERICIVVTVIVHMYSVMNR